MISDEEVISLSHAKVYVFSDSVLCLRKMNQNPFSNVVWEFCNKIHEFMSRMCDPSQFKGRIIFMSMFNDILWVCEDNETECIAKSTLVSLFAKRFPAGHWSFLVSGSEKKWYSTYLDRRQGEWDRVAQLMVMKFGERDTQFSVLRVHCPRNTQKQRRWKTVNTLLRRWRNDWNIFPSIFFLNQLSIYGAVSDLCDEYWACQARTARPVLAGQYDPLFEPASLLVTTPAPSTEHPAQEDSIAKVQRTSGKALTTKSCD